MCLQRQCKFENLAITETHLDSSISNIEGMKFLSFEGKPGKGGSCILFYSIPNIYALCIGKTCLLTALRLSGCRSSSRVALLCFRLCTKCDPTAGKLLHIFDALNLQKFVQEPRETPSSSTVIDLIVTTRKDLVSLVETYPLGISDHNLTYSTIMLKNKRPLPKII